MGNTVLDPSILITADSPTLPPMHAELEIAQIAMTNTAIFKAGMILS
jgi:hypothetical protein